MIRRQFLNFIPSGFPLCRFCIPPSPRRRQRSVLHPLGRRLQCLRRAAPRGFHPSQGPLGAPFPPFPKKGFVEGTEWRYSEDKELGVGGDRRGDTEDRGGEAGGRMRMKEYGIFHSSSPLTTVDVPTKILPSFMFEYGSPPKTPPWGTGGLKISSIPLKLQRGLCAHPPAPRSKLPAPVAPRSPGEGPAPGCRCRPPFVPFPLRKSLPPRFSPSKLRILDLTHMIVFCIVFFYRCLVYRRGGICNSIHFPFYRPRAPPPRTSMGPSHRSPDRPQDLHRGFPPHLVACHPCCLPPSSLERS